MSLKVFVALAEPAGHHFSHLAEELEVIVENLELLDGVLTGRMRKESLPEELAFVSAQIPKRKFDFVAGDFSLVPAPLVLLPLTLLLLLECLLLPFSALVLKLRHLLLMLSLHILLVIRDGLFGTAQPGDILLHDTVVAISLLEFFVDVQLRCTVDFVLWLLDINIDDLRVLLH